MRRHTDLGTFLRSCRESLSPEECGLPLAGRRRTPGLRRDEVATLARISLTWYTFLEQGRAIRASAATIARLADVLRLTETERRHLAMLAGVPGPDLAHPKPLPKAVRHLVESLAPSPACVLDHRFDIVAANSGFQLVWPDLREPGSQTNFLWRFFSDPMRSIVDGEWNLAASFAVKHFRSSYARRADERVRSLVDNLCDYSGDFRELWERPEATQPKNFDHVFRLRISESPLQMRFTYLKVFAPGDYLICVIAPADTDSHESLRALLHHAAARSV